MEQKLRSFFLSTKGLLITLCAFTAFAVFALYVFDYTGNSISDEQAELLERNLYSAAIGCYAVSGRYPTLEEIQDEYGLVIDSDHYQVNYSAFASNIIPEIEVRLIEEVER